MNQTFNFQRWSLLISNHWAENRKRYLLSVIAIICLLVLWFVFIMLTDSWDPLAKGLQEVTFYFSLFIVGPFYASQFYNELSSKSKGINYLLIPATLLEKLLCGLFYALVVFPIAFIAAFYLVDVIITVAANAFHSSYDGSQLRNNTVLKARVTNVFNLQGSVSDSVNMSYYFILGFFAIQSAFLLGSVYFTKYSYIKTAISLTLALFVLFLVINSLMPSGRFSIELNSVTIFTKDNKRLLVELPKWIGNLLNQLFLYVFPPIFWLTTYYRLREKEI